MSPNKVIAEALIVSIEYSSYNTSV